MKVRRPNRNVPIRNQNTEAAVKKKLKFVILQQVNVISLLLLQILLAIENYSIFKNENFTYELSNSCKHFIRLLGLPSVHLKHACEVAIFIFQKNKQGIRACVVSNFHPGLEKNVNYMENLEFSSRVEISSRVG